MGVRHMGKILCVGGNADLIDLLRNVLTHEGYTVSVAHTGQDALRLMRAGGFDLAIIDGDVPDMSGIALFPALRIRSRIPVLALMARSQDEAVATHLAQHADGYVSKPFNVRRLIDHVDAVLRW